MPYRLNQGFPNWDTCTPGVHFDYSRNTLDRIFYYLMLILMVKIRAAPPGRATKKMHMTPDVLYTQELPFSASCVFLSL